MVVTKSRKQVSQYTTWYDFRKQLADQLGYVPLNSLWLEVKPKSPLPWNNADMRVVLSTVACLEKQRTTRKLESGMRKRYGCEEWSDCYTCPITIDECALWYNNNLL